MNAPAAAQPDSLGAAQRRLARRFAASGLASPALDARLLLAEAAGMTPDALMRHSDRPPPAGTAGRLEAFAARRLAGEPVGRILGRREFWGLSFSLSPETLEPRPDTETLVAAALDLLPADAPSRILDLGTGSGCILVALLAERPRAFGIGTDLAPGALATARANALAAGTAARAAFLCADWADPIAGRFDLVVSNPPYIRKADLAGLTPEVRLHDPPRALDGGADGLDSYRRLVQQSVPLLAPGGAVLFEVGHDQAAAIAGLVEAVGLKNIADRRDLSGHIRVVAAQAPA